jgi:hypothetical protein
MKFKAAVLGFLLTVSFSAPMAITLAQLIAIPVDIIG